MGTFRVDGWIENIADRHRSAKVSGMLVDTGSDYSWLPTKALERIGAQREKKGLTLVMADGK